MSNMFSRASIEALLPSAGKYTAKVIGVEPAVFRNGDAVVRLDWQAALWTVQQSLTIAATTPRAKRELVADLSTVLDLIKRNGRGDGAANLEELCAKLMGCKAEITVGREKPGAKLGAYVNKVGPVPAVDPETGEIVGGSNV